LAVGPSRSIGRSVRVWFARLARSVGRARAGGGGEEAPQQENTRRDSSGNQPVDAARAVDCVHAPARCGRQRPAHRPSLAAASSHPTASAPRHSLGHSLRSSGDLGLSRVSTGERNMSARLLLHSGRPALPLLRRCRLRAAAPRLTHAERAARGLLGRRDCRDRSGQRLNRGRDTGWAVSAGRRLPRRHVAPRIASQAAGAPAA
jgi:hypothetical protein